MLFNSILRFSVMAEWCNFHIHICIVTLCVLWRWISILSSMVRYYLKEVHCWKGQWGKKNSGGDCDKGNVTELRKSSENTVQLASDCTFYNTVSVWNLHWWQKHNKRDHICRMNVHTYIMYACGVYFFRYEKPIWNAFVTSLSACV